MADIFTKEKRSQVMSLIKGRDSILERNFELKLLEAKIKHTRHVAELPGKPDFVLPKHKTAIFIDSCFWHGCRHHFKSPKTNKKFWTEKIQKNKLRDKEVNKEYKKTEWRAIRLWEHTLKRANIEDLIADIIKR